MHANHLDLGPHRLDVVGHATHQPAAANGHKHRVQAAGVLAQDFHGHRPLAGNYVRVVKGVDKGQALFFLQGERVVVRVGIAVTIQHHFTAKAAHRVHFDLRRGGGHHDEGSRAQASRTQRYPLGMVAG